MYSVSSEYLLQLENNVHRHRLSGAIGSVPISDDNVVEGSLSIHRQCSEPSIIKIGGVYTSELRGKFINVNIGKGEWVGKTITFSEGLHISSLNEYEYVPLGTFKIAEATHSLEGVSIVAYDNMILFDDIVNFTTTVGTPYELLSYICSSCNVTLGLSQAQIESFPNGTETLTIHGNNDIKTYRDLLSWISQTLCSFATINRNGALILVRYSNNPIYSIDEYNRFNDCSFSDYSTRYTGMGVVRIDAQDYKYYSVYPDNALAYDLGENPLVQDKYHIVQNIINEFSLLNLTPFSARILSGACFDLGDCIGFTGGLAGNIKCAIMDIDYTYNGGIKFEGYGDNPNLINAKSSTDNRLNGLASRSASATPVFFSFLNASQINIVDSGTASVANFHIVATDPTWFTLTIELKANISTVETSTSTAYTENDMVATATININGQDETYHPIITETDGTRLLHINHAFRQGAGAVIINVTLTCQGGSINIPIGCAKAYILGINLEDLELDSIHLVTSPTKTTYFVGEQLDLDGTVIGAVYNDGTSTVITDLCTFSPADGDILNEEGEQAVIATYEEGTDVYTVDIPIEVIHRDSLDYLIYTEEPTRYVVTNINVTAIQRDSVNSLEIESEYNQKSTTLDMQ